MAEREPNIGVIGTHVSESLSSVMHNAAYREMGLDLHYGTFQIGDAGEQEPGEYLATRLDELVGRGVVGLSVTMPFKVDILQSGRIRSRSNSVTAIGSCNTLSLYKNYKWNAENTDWLGAAQSIEEAGVKIEGKSALILGSMCAAGA